MSEQARRAISSPHKSRWYLTSVRDTLKKSQLIKLVIKSFILQCNWSSIIITITEQSLSLCAPPTVSVFDKYVACVHVWLIKMLKMVKYNPAAHMINIIRKRLRSKCRHQTKCEIKSQSPRLFLSYYGAEYWPEMCFRRAASWICNAITSSLFH